MLLAVTVRSLLLRDVRAPAFISPGKSSPRQPSFLSFLARALTAFILFILTFSIPAVAVTNETPDRADAKKLKVDSYPEYTPEDSSFVKKFLKPGTYMRQSEIKPGMEGYGLSVFRGSKPEKFQVKVIGVMKRVMNGKDAILVRLSGSAIGKNNVIRGMSGSPIYIDGKLIGALSYGFDFSMEPIAGVTPIVDMLDSIAKSQDAPGAGSTNPLLKTTLDVSPYVIPGATSDLSGLRRQMVASSSPHMVPLISPISLCGFSSRAQQFLSKRFERFGLPVSEGAAGGSDNQLPEDDLKELGALKPGSAVGVMLTTGDFESAAVGTVTTTFGDRVLAFGHPFVQAGTVDFPMTSAYVHDVLPSISISFKLSSPVKVLGTVYSDRPWSVGGELGAKAKMVPLLIEVSDEDRHIKRTFQSKVIDHQDLTPELISACAMSAIDATYQSSIPYVAHVDTTVEMDKAPTIKRSDCLSNSYGGAGMAATVFKGPLFTDPVAGNVFAITSRVLSNKYEKAHLRAVSLKIRLESGRNVTRITRVATDRSQVKPGEKVRLTCTLAPYDGEPYEKTLEMDIPRDAPDGELVLGVSGGTQVDELRRRMGLIDPPNQNLNQIVRRIQNRPEGDKLFAVLSLPNQAIHVDGEVIQSPPGHWIKLFFSNRYTHGPSLVNGERKVIEDVDTLLEGSHILAVEVKRGDEYLARQPWYQAQPKGSGKATSGFYVTSQAQKAIDALGKSDTKGKTDTTAQSSTNTETSAAQTTSTKAAPGLSLWSPGVEDPHIRSMQVWSQTEESAFKGGTRNGVTIDSWGRMFPAFEELGVVQIPNALRAWSGTWSNNAFFFATSNRICKVTDMHSKPVELAKLDCVTIPSMVADSGGRIYAAAAPGGRIISIDPNSGVVKQLASLNESLITCLSVDSQNNLYAGAAGTGKVYKISANGSASLVFDTGQAHVVSMFFDKHTDSLLVGCGEQGNVYSIGRNGEAKSVFHCDEHLVTGVCRTKHGELFVTTAGDGHLYRISAHGEIFDLATSDAFYSLYYHDETGAVFAGDAEGDVTEIQQEPLTGQSFFVPVKHSTQEAVVAVSSDGAGNLYALSSNLPAVYGFRIRPQTSSFISPVKDAGRKARWSHVRLYGAYNELDSEFQHLLSVDSRSGNTPMPDETWSTWIPAAPTQDGFSIKGGEARYYQYRIRWAGKPAGTDISTFPCGRESVIGRVAVTYLPSNLPPRYTSVSLRSGSYISDNEDITVVGNDPDGDSLSLAINISSDRGKTWRLLEDDLRPEKTLAKPSSTGKKGSEKAKKSSEGSKRPAEESKKSGEDLKKPAETKKPGEDLEKPDEESKKPGEEPKKPDEGPSKPREESRKPGGETKKPDGESKKQQVESTAGGEGQFLLDDGPQPLSLPEGAESRRRLQSPPDEDKPETPSDKGEEQGSKEKSQPETGKEAGKEESAEKGKKTQTKKGKGEQEKPPQAEGSEKKKSTAEEQTEKFVYPLLTKTLKDGPHIIKFTLSDAPSNMVSPQVLSCYRYVVVDNTKPKIKEARATVGGDGTVNIEAEAQDDASPIINATFTIDEGEPRAFAVSGEGLADSQTLKLVATGVKVKKAPRKIEIEVVDKANNKATRTVKVSGR